MFLQSGQAAKVWQKTIKIYVESRSAPRSSFGGQNAPFWINVWTFLHRKSIKKQKIEKRRAKTEKTREKTTKPSWSDLGCQKQDLLLPGFWEGPGHGRDVLGRSRDVPGRPRRRPGGCRKRQRERERPKVRFCNTLYVKTIFSRVRRDPKRTQNGLKTEPYNADRSRAPSRAISQTVRTSPGAWRPQN